MYKFICKVLDKSPVVFSAGNTNDYEYNENDF